KHTTNSFIHIPSPTLYPVDQLSHDIYITTTTIQRSSLDCV
ncbi:unnamed protein product, partial [Brassica rapa subsp. narinosa]